MKNGLETGEKEKRAKAVLFQPYAHIGRWSSNELQALESETHNPLTEIGERHLLEHHICEDGNPLGKVLLRTEHLLSQ